MAIKKTTIGDAPALKPNAMVVEMIRTGLLYYFDGEKVVLLYGGPPTITEPTKITFPGKVIYDFQEKEELRQILAGDGDSYVLEGITETIRVVARFHV